MMNEKDNDSIATVQMKPEYAPSEVYSTASEPPPAYKMRNSNSVKIAKIVGCTVICSALIIGLCILGSTYLQAKASCNYMDSVQAALEKELLLDRFDDYPRAEALHESESNNLLNAINKKSIPNDIIDNDIDAKSSDSSKVEADSKSTTEATSSEEPEEVKRVQVKLPLELELDHIANAILEQNQKAKMNCIVERRRAEEIVDAPGRTLQLPFGLNINTDPKQKKVTGERLVIMCESGMEHNNNENNNVNENDDVEEIRQIVVPINAIPLQFGPRGPQYPLTHLPMHQMPQQQQQQQQQPQHQFPMFLPQPQTEMRPPPFMMPPRPQEMQEHRFQPQQNPMFRQLPPQPQPQPQQFHFQQRQPIIQIRSQQQEQQPEPQQQFHHQMPPHFQFMRAPQSEQQPPVPATMMQAPRPEMPEIRIQLHRIQIPMGDSSEESIEQSPQQAQTQQPTIQIQRQLPQQPQQQQEQGREMQQVQVQEVPLSVALQRAGITPDDLRNIQRIAEAKIHEELRQFVTDDDSSDSDSDSNSDDSDKSDDSATQQRSSQESDSSELERQLLPIGRMISFGRSLINPVRIPVPMMPFMQQAQENQSQVESDESERPHFVHPRSVDDSVKEKIE